MKIWNDMSTSQRDIDSDGETRPNFLAFWLLKNPQIPRKHHVHHKSLFFSWLGRVSFRLCARESAYDARRACLCNHSTVSDSWKKRTLQTFFSPLQIHLSISPDAVGRSPGGRAVMSKKKRDEIYFWNIHPEGIVHEHKLSPDSCEGIRHGRRHITRSPFHWPPQV